MAYNRVRTPRFYIDAAQLMRARGGIFSSQPTIIPESGVPWVSASDMFHNNGTKNWKTDMFEGWQQPGADATIDVTCAWDDNEHTFDNKFWQTDLYLRFNNYVPLTTMNYFAFLGHNLGRALTQVQPFICKSGVDGAYETTTIGDTTLDHPVLNLSDVIDDMHSDNHSFHGVDYVEDGRFEFFRFIGTGEGEGSEEAICYIDGEPNYGTTQEDCETVGGEWTPPIDGEYNDTGNLKYTAADLGWNVLRFNDNSQSTDTFNQVWNKLGDGEMINQYNTIGIRTYKYEGEAAQTGGSSVWRRCPQINAFSCGWTYVMEHSPDLEIEQTWEFDGINTKTGLGGQNITNIDYNGPAGWEYLKRDYNSSGVVDGGYSIATNHAWGYHSSDLGTNYGFGGNHGRRVWKLKFSYMNDQVADASGSDVGGFGANQKGIFNDKHNRDSRIHLDWGNSENNASGEGYMNINKNFFTRVIHGTMGGKLPFLFQPDSEYEDEIFLCEFEGKEITFEQVAPNVYNFDLTIREVW